MVVRLRLASNPAFVVMTERLTTNVAHAYVTIGPDDGGETERGADVLVLARESEHVCRHCRRERFLTRSSFVLIDANDALPYPYGKVSHYQALHNVHLMDFLSSDVVAAGGA
jgi:hypothetical protein